jgi:hypothetical protein
MRASAACWRAAGAQAPASSAALWAAGAAAGRPAAAGGASAAATELLRAPSRGFAASAGSDDSYSPYEFEDRIVYPAPRRGRGRGRLGGGGGREARTRARTRVRAHTQRTHAHDTHARTHTHARTRSHTHMHTFIPHTRGCTRAPKKHTHTNPLLSTREHGTRRARPFATPRARPHPQGLCGGAGAGVCRARCGAGRGRCAGGAGAQGRKGGGQRKRVEAAQPAGRGCRKRVVAGRSRPAPSWSLVGRRPRPRAPFPEHHGPTPPGSPTSRWGPASLPKPPDVPLPSPQSPAVVGGDIKTIKLSDYKGK